MLELSALAQLVDALDALIAAGEDRAGDALADHAVASFRRRREVLVAERETLIASLTIPVEDALDACER